MKEKLYHFEQSFKYEIPIWIINKAGERVDPKTITMAQASAEEDDDKRWIEGVASTLHRDLQKEVVELEGLNIDTLLDGEGEFNEDHKPGFFHTLGTITEARKILIVTECKCDKEIKWFQEYGPFLYIKGYLYKNHPNAQAAWSLMTEGKRKMRFSIEGKIISKTRDRRVTLAKINKIALTLSPVNTQTLAEIVKSLRTGTILCGSVSCLKVCTGTCYLHKSKKNISAFDKMTPYLLFKSLKKIKKQLEEEEDPIRRKVLQVLAAKAMSAGAGYLNAPTKLSGGEALQTESLEEDEENKDNLKDLNKAGVATDIPSIPSVNRLAMNMMDQYNQQDHQKSIIANYDHGSIKPYESGMEESSKIMAAKDSEGVTTHRVSVGHHEDHDKVYGNMYDLSHQSMGHRQVSYHNLGHSFFGTKDLMKPMALYHDGNQHYAVTEHKKGNMTFDDMYHNLKNPDGVIDKHIDHHFKNGDLFKLFAQDYVTGNVNNRDKYMEAHPAKGELQMASNGEAFPENVHSERDKYFSMNVPKYIEHAHSNLPGADQYMRENDFPNDFKRHISEMDPIKMADLMRRTGTHTDAIKGALNRLSRLKEIVVNEGSMSYKLGRIYPESNSFGHHKDSYEHGKRQAEQEMQYKAII